MGYEVRLTERARDDVEHNLQWFASNFARESGQRWLSLLDTKLETLVEHPDRCSLAPEFVGSQPEIRELLLGRGRHRHRLLFSVVEKTVVILRIWHSARAAPTSEDVDA